MTLQADAAPYLSKLQQNTKLRISRLLTGAMAKQVAKTAFGYQYLFSVQNRPGLPASGKEPEKSSHSTMDKRRPMIYLG